MTYTFSNLTASTVASTVASSVNVSVKAAPPPSILEYTFRALSIEERDGWFGVSIETFHAPSGIKFAQAHPLSHVEIERLILLWLADNAEHRYVVLMTSIQFKHEDDAMAFYLRFSGGVTLS
jgi:hypothetical protein